MENKNLLNNLWKYAEEKDTAEKRKLYNYLDRDYINDIILDGDVFWIESNGADIQIPDYVNNIIIKYFEKKGYRYLYNI